MSGGLSGVPTVPQGIISTWLVTNGGPGAGQAVPYAAHPQHPPLHHTPPHIEEVFPDNQQQQLEQQQ
eukprot:1403672-Prorocentrum_lima.AAC.1